MRTASVCSEACGARVVLTGAWRSRSAHAIQGNRAGSDCRRQRHRIICPLTSILGIGVLMQSRQQE
jgi:hypothetical protein